MSEDWNLGDGSTRGFAWALLIISLLFGWIGLMLWTHDHLLALLLILPNITYLIIAVVVIRRDWLYSRYMKWREK